MCHDHVYEEAAVQADIPSQLFTSNPVHTKPQRQAIPQLIPQNPNSLVFHSNIHPFFTSHGHTLDRSSEERRREKEKDLEDIKKMIEESCRF